MTIKSELNQDAFLSDPIIRELDSVLARLKPLEHNTEKFTEQYAVVHNLAYELVSIYGHLK